jgi:uncharacterized protein (TIGR00661 family)
VVPVKILYGVVGEGMGHATRSRVILEDLLQKGHQVHVVVSGRAHRFMADKFKGRPGIAVDEIHGLHLSFEGNDLDLSESVVSNLAGAPPGLLKNLGVWRKINDEFAADVVVSDFESFAWLFARVERLPVISIDNMQVINRCAHDDFVSDDSSFAFRLAKFAVKAKLPGAYHYLVRSIFFPKVKKPRTTLVSPILRPEILAARREPGDHVLVYQTAAANAEHLLTTLKKLPYRFKAYGTGRSGQDGNVHCMPFAEQGFVDDLRTARCVVAGGGYSLMGEAVHLHVPMLSIPIGGQYEQELNARYLQKLGYGRAGDAVDAEVIDDFVKHAPSMQQALEGYQPRDNSILFGCLDELLRDVSLDEPPPETLQTPNLGSYTPKLPAALADVVDDDTEDFTDPKLLPKPKARP